MREATTPVIVCDRTSMGDNAKSHRRSELLAS